MSLQEAELRLFISGFFLMTQDVISGVLGAIENILPYPETDDVLGDRSKAGAAAAAARRSDLRERLKVTISNALKTKQEAVNQSVLTVADVDNDGLVSLSEWQTYCRVQPLGRQLLKWVDQLGQYWVAVSNGEGIVAEGDGTRQLNSLALQSFLSTKLRGVRLPSLIAAQARAPDRLDEARCAQLFAELGIRNSRLSAVLFSIFDPLVLPGERVPTVDSREALVGLSTLCAGSSTLTRGSKGASDSADQAKRLEFAFEIFDADRNGNLDQDELRRFFAMFRRPLLAKVEQAMGRFYRSCGYEEELREQIATAATSTFDDYVDTVVPEIFAQADTDMDRLLTKHEFMHWARRHPQSLRWLDNLALYLLASVAGQLRTEDFDDVDDFQITT